ncbi:major facilitator superfamily domain-containing protein [Rhexocercosporidium sp. MPI-PUGE-AT-0058]|nr:major facilitator superfamily domain-containing protein [Rhexocercosporidium sp. MPI-PUGE-AT-0058]
MTPLTGVLYRMFNLKIMYLGFVGVFELGCLVAGTATSSSALIVGRAISGIGSGGLITGTTTIIAATVPLNRRAFVMGVGMACLALGQTVGPILGGVLTNVSWRWCFYINLPLGGVVAIVLGFFIKFPVKRLTTTELTVLQRIMTIDIVGFLGFASACVLLLLGLEQGGDTYAWNSATVIGLLCGGAVMFAGLIGWFIHRGDAALIPPRLSRDRINLAIGITAFVQSGGVFTAAYWLPIWFQGVKGASPLSSGTMILPSVISQLIASLICGGLVQKTGYYLPEVIGGNCLVLAGAALMSSMQPGTPMGNWIGYQILLGTGRGFVMQLLVTAIQTNLPAEDASLGSAYVLFAQYFGGAIFAAVTKTVFTSSIGPAISKYAPDLDPALLINSGVTELRHVVPAQYLEGAILAYNQSINHVFDVQLAAASAALLTGCFVGWRKVNAKKSRKADEETNAPTAEKSETIAGKSDEKKVVS